MPDTRTSDLKSDLLKFLVSLLENSDKSLLALEEDLTCLEEAKRVSLATTQAELNTLKQDYKFVSETMGDKPQFKEMLVDAKLDIELMTAKLAEAVASYERTAKYYGEDPAKVPPEDFFAIFHKFTVQVQTGLREMVAARAAEEKAKLREETKQKRLAEQESKRKAGFEEPVESGHDNFIDNLSNLLGDGSAFRRMRENTLPQNEGLTIDTEEEPTESPRRAVRGDRSMPVMLTMSTSIGVRIQKFGAAENEEYPLRKVKKFYTAPGCIRFNFGDARAKEAVFYSEHCDKMMDHMTSIISAVTAARKQEMQIRRLICWRLLKPPC